MLSVAGGGIAEMCVSGITVDKVYSRRETSADISCFKGNQPHCRRSQEARGFELGELSTLACVDSHSRISPKTVWHCPQTLQTFQFPHLHRIPIQSLQLTPNSLFPALSAESQCSTASNTRRAALVVDNTSVWPCKPLRRWIRRQA